MTILLVVGILVFLIVVHEFGHFVAAKIFGVKVQEFGIGYPPRAFRFGKWGETEYSLNWLPFGGFVRLLGEESGAEGSTQSRSLAAAPLYVQAIILVAGVLANALAAWLLFAGAYTLGIPRAVEPGAEEGARLVVSSVVAGSPADISGLSPGDEIVQMIDTRTGASPENTPEAITAFVSERGGQSITVSFARGGEGYVETIRPAHAVVPDAEGRPALGVGLVLISEESLPFGQALMVAFPRTVDAFKTVAVGLWNLLSSAVMGKGNLNEVVGPVGLVEVVGSAAQHGFGYVLALAGFISVNLTIINLIPIPALDGGRLALIAYEGVTRRRARHVTFQLLNVIGIICIGFLMIAVTWNDISRLLG